MSTLTFVRKAGLGIYLSLILPPLSPSHSHSHSCANHRSATMCPHLKNLKILADKGDRSAQFNLGMKYDNGRGIEKNYKKAFLYYQLAADQGHPDAQYNVGLMYQFGEGVCQNYKQAIKHFRMSTSNGCLDAECALKELVPKGP